LNEYAKYILDFYFYKDLPNILHLEVLLDFKLIDSTWIINWNIVESGIKHHNPNPK
jgi:hypothetical protein